MLNGNDLDLELLSAYLDGALTEPERVALEARLQTDADLRHELARLRATVDLVKTLPTLTAPRNFTLTRQAARRPSILTSPAFSALSTAAAVILLMLGVLLSSQRSSNNASVAFSTDARDSVALAPTQTTLVEPGVVVAATQLGFVGEETGGAANTVEAPQDTDGTFLAAPPPVANQAAPSSEQANAQPAEGDDQVMQYATGTSAPLPTSEPMMDVLRFAADATGTLDEFNTQLRVDDETETQASQDAAADMADSSASLTQQESAPAPAFVAGGAAAPESPLPQATQMPTEKPSTTPTYTPSPAPTMPPPTQTPSPMPTSTLAPTDTPMAKATQPPPSATPVPPEQPVQRAPDSSTLGVVLIVTALALFGVALVTTVARRRG